MIKGLVEHTKAMMADLVVCVSICLDRWPVLTIAIIFILIILSIMGIFGMIEDLLYGPTSLFTI